MFEYKDEAFFNNYFKGQDGYKLISEFEKIKTGQKEELYVGYVECLNTVHSLVLRIEIPIFFPHQKLTIWTSSLLGYPHLINNGKPNFNSQPTEFEEQQQLLDWSWFCLNAPFAEEAEEQLNQELKQLQLWVKRLLRPELPAKITDPELRGSLAIIDPVNWNSPDFSHEIRTDAKVTFVGEDFQRLSLFKKDYNRQKNQGVLKCLKHAPNKIYIFNDDAECNDEIPYILVEDFPVDISDFFALRQQYQWSDEVVKALIPLSVLNSKITSNTNINQSFYFKHTKEDVQSLLVSLKEMKEQPINPMHKDIVHKEIDSLIKEYSPTDKPQKSKFDFCVGIPPKREDYSSDEEYEEAEDAYTQLEIEEQMQEQMIEEWQHKENLRKWTYHTFLLGVVDEINDEIFWISITSREIDCTIWKETPYDLISEKFIVKDLEGLRLHHQLPNIIRYKDYFGRGAASINLTDKKVAIIGLGAIGSQVAEALARYGIKEFGLWDKDIIEPGNLCRASYERRDIGETKANATYRRIKAISPFANIIYGYNTIDEVQQASAYINERIGHHLYGKINYASQEDVLKELEPYDIIIDCTASNELLHFLSYAIKDKWLLSLCITNHSSNLLCISNTDGNCFELRKTYLSKIEQDTQNYYHEGSGCYSPTFLAGFCDIATLVNLAIHDINKQFESNKNPISFICSYDERGIIVDRLKHYRCDLLNGNMVDLVVPSEALYDVEDMEYTQSEPIGYIFGAYSRDCTQIMITHFVTANEAEYKIEEVYSQTDGLIDYLGDIDYSCTEGSEKYKKVLSSIQQKAWATNVNINNPVLAMKNQDGSVSFFLYFNGKLLPFIQV